MSTRTLPLGFVATLLSIVSPGAAQSPVALPEICTASAGHDMSSMPQSHQAHVDEAHAALMEGMDEMSADMMKAMSASDIDVAFVCGMIPHHLGAISMAKAELAHGDDPWAKETAQKIIDAQTAEIAAMLAWLEAQPK